MKMYKTCKNDNCYSYNRRIKCSNTDKYCMKCASNLIHVCKNKGCLAPLESDTAILCPDCLQKIQEKKEERKKTADTTIKKGPEAVSALAAVVPVAIGVAKKIIKK